VVNASLRRKPLQLKIGSGLSPEEFRARGRAGTLGHMGLLESVAMIGAALGWELDAIEQTLDPLVADTAIRTDALEVAAGQVRVSIRSPPARCGASVASRSTSR
jgi:2,4-diaminopentanoate dehydrogenase